MILEGNERGNGAELAQHLMNARDNEHVTVHAINGFVADDLYGAFAEAEAIAAATQCQKYLFSLSLNPPPDVRVSIDVFEDAAQRAAQSLGLADQPYAIVFHEKHGRRHAHCVWSRIDGAKLKAINIAHYKRKLMAISRVLYIENGWDMPAGFEDHQKRDPLNFSRNEAGQAKRVKRDAQALKSMFHQCWQASDTCSSFAASLWAEGYVLARGHRRGFVAVDANGEIYSLSRWCGVRTKELRARLGDPLDLPSVEEAHTLFEARVVEQAKAKAVHENEFQTRLDQLVARQRIERDELLKNQEQRHAQECVKRNERLPRGMRLVWARISGAYDRLIVDLENEAAACDARDQQEHQALIDKHLSARRAFERRHRFDDLGAELGQAFADALCSDPRQRLDLPEEDVPFTRAQLQRNPELILDYISEKQARFTALDVKRNLTKFIDNPLALRGAIDKALMSDELVALDGGGYTTMEYAQSEMELFDAADAMARSPVGAVRAETLSHAMAIQNNKMQRAFGGQLSDEQGHALRHICSDDQLSCVVGLAGAGKSTMLEAANAAWTKQGIQVHGAALSGKAADGLLASSGIESRTLASLELSWKNGHEPIGKGDVLVVDEAGMIGTRQLSRLMVKMNQIGAKLVLIGDPDQLQPIEAGQPFRRLVNNIGAARLNEIHRQRAEWQKLASRDLAAGRVQEAMNAYDHNGGVHHSQNQKQALAALVEAYMVDVESSGVNKTRLAFAHRRKDVFALNQAIRGALRQADEIDHSEQVFETETGPRVLAARDRIVFTSNNKELGVKNGMLGTVEKIDGSKISVRFGDLERTRVTFDANSYRSFDHGYAVTVHKSQGATVDRSYVLASRTLDASLTYVAMTRHRDDLRLFVSDKDRPRWAKASPRWEQRHLRHGPSM
ncbi:AAA family ATPase [Shimia aestuarii]|uniref:AAA family ATPase n=1 Tax=Shimia aestuarii TaxID=254406 RepID=UPI001FB4BBE1|nr:AAA family ATPase [Shimia aestuarii]